MSKMYNRARVTVSSTGTGSLTLSTAVAGYQTFTSAGVQNNDVVSYVIEDGLNWEVGEGTYTSSTNTLSRTVTQSFNGSTYGTSPISVTASAQVFISPLAADIVANGSSATLGIANGGTGLTALGSGVSTGLATSTNAATGFAQLDSSAKVPGANSAREVLTANRTYYVRTDGSNSNNGLANTAGGAFLTIQKAVDVVSTIDIATYTVTIQLGNTGTWTSGITVNSPWVGNGEVILQGDTVTPSNTTISTTNSNCVTVQNGGRLSLQSFRMTTTTGGACVATLGGTVKIKGGVVFAATATFQMSSVNNGVIFADYGTGAYSITGGGWCHWFADASSIISFRATTITITGTPAFSVQFAQINGASVAQVDALTFSGTATGTRYLSQTNAVLGTGGGGANYLPGNVAGSTATGGQYT